MPLQTRYIERIWTNRVTNDEFTGEKKIVKEIHKQRDSEQVQQDQNWQCSCLFCPRFLVLEIA